MSASPSVHEPSAARPAGTPVILVADDSHDNCDLLADQLRSLGYRPVLAHDAAGTLAAVRLHRPDLVILDVQMPAAELGVDDRGAGYEVCRRIKQDPATQRIPVVFITALNDTGDRLLAIEAGGDDFLTKPHNRLVLGARVRALLRLKAATDALEESFRRLRELERARDDLMKMIVHDLKTPLTNILATLELLGDGHLGALTTTQRSAVQDAMGKSDELLNLIDDLLEVRRIEEAAITLSVESVAPQSLVEEVIRESIARFEQEGTRVHADLEAGLPDIRGDRALLRRVIHNLVQNALVHSGRAIDLWFSGQVEGHGVRLTVRDSGMGIPPELHDAIFRKFQQGGVPYPRTSGLGLTFCRLVVQAHGGRIWVESAPGDGATFHVWLPFDPPERTVRLGAEG